MTSFRFLTPQPLALLSVTITTDRLQLVVVSDRFASDIFQEFTPEVTRYMFPSPPTAVEETLSFIAESRRAVQAGNTFTFAILSKQTAEFLGCCGLHGKDNARTPELGIWLKQSAHGHGYGREAVHVVVH
jgi:[ribosomal protein S5]-alanine N-acetyltransferase